MEDIAISKLFGDTLFFNLGPDFTKRYKIRYRQEYGHYSPVYDYHTITGVIEEVEISSVFYRNSYIKVRTTRNGVKSIDVRNLIRIQEVK